MSNTNDQPQRLMLQMPLAKAQERLQSQINKGYAFIGTIEADSESEDMENDIISLSELIDLEQEGQRIRSDIINWIEYNVEFFKTIVTTNELYEEYFETIIPASSSQITTVENILIGTPDNRVLGILRRMIRKMES